MFNVKSTVILLVLSIKVIASGSTDDEPAELIFSHVIFRHGDRNPLISYPNDPWKDEANWPGGYAQLTNKGKREMYELGKCFRRRYIQSLLRKGSYSPKTVYVRSSDIDRTLMSSSSFLAGFYPPRDHQIWKRNIGQIWQPIPVHTIPQSYDYVFFNTETNCPRFNEALEKYEKSPEYQNIFIKHKSLFEYMEKYSGMPIKTLIDVYKLYDTLSIQNKTNKALPEWTKKIFVLGGDMEMLASLCLATYTNTPELARFYIGFLLREILDRFDEKIQSKLVPDRSLWLYSAHDITIASVLNSIGLFKVHLPPSAASLLIQLYKQQNEFYFQIIYRKSSVDISSPLDIPLCGKKCSITKFREAYKEIIPTGSYEDECKL